MKKIILAIASITVAALVYLVFQFRGAAPAILPPKLSSLGTAPITTSTKNELGLKIPEGFSIDIFAKDLDGPRDLVFDDTGNLLASIPSKGRIVAISNQGEVTEILANLTRPHGLALYGTKLYVAQETKVSRYNWNPQDLSATLDKMLFSLPAGGRHFTRSIAFKNDGTMFISIGSTCDVCKEKDPFSAAVIVSDKDSASPRIFARGLRNTVFITVNGDTQKLWGTEMGRDFLGDNLPPDEINIIEDSKDYGWPSCFGDRTVDLKFDPDASQDACRNTQPPLYKLCAHCAPLGLAFINSKQFPEGWQGDLLVAFHGSWNSSKPVGYKVVKLKVKGDNIIGEEDFISGFLKGAQTIGRPAGLAFGPDGSLYISDDKAGVIYRLWRNGQN